MPVVLRQPNADTNPILAGGVYGKYITIGRAFYWYWDGTQTRFIILIADGGRYGLDALDTCEYKGAGISEFIFHRGTVTKQIEPVSISATNTGTDTFTSVGHPFINGDVVRVAPIDGALSPQLSKNVKYYIKDKTADTFKFSLTDGGATHDIVDAGVGGLIVWKANTGFDDPEQGLPTYCPEVNTTLSNIAYVEGKIPVAFSVAGQEPDWTQFRLAGTGRRLMDYDNTGAEIGLLVENERGNCNVALQIIDNLLVNYDIEPERIHYSSWFDLKEASYVQILQRPKNTDTALGVGNWTGRYYANNNFSELIATRLDSLINFDFGTSEPFAGMGSTDYSIRSNGQVKPLFTEVYTLTLEHNDGGKIFVNGQLVLSNPVTGTHSVQMLLTANQVYDFQVELVQSSGSAVFKLQWQSDSQALSYIPAVSQDVIDTSLVDRYANSMAATTDVEASEYHERLMERVVGWDWTDDDGLIKFLPPNREPVFTFGYDAEDDDSQANFVQGKFSRKRRRIATRKNFKLSKYRNSQKIGYPVEFAEADREGLRRLQNSRPNNDPATDLGVMTRSLAERMAEFDMVLKSDPKSNLSIEGLYPSSKIRKNHIFLASYYDFDGNFVENDRFITSLHSWGSKDGKNGFEALPIKADFYVDEPITTAEENPPTDLEVTFDTGSGVATIVWENHNALGVIYLERKRDDNSYEIIATLPFNTTSHLDTITLNGTYTYRVRNANLEDYSNEDSIVVTTETDEGDVPTGLAVSINEDNSNFVDTVWTNHGGTGDNIIERKPLGGSFAEVGRVAHTESSFTDETITLTNTYTYRIRNEDEAGYSNEEEIEVSISGGGEVGLYPVELYAEAFSSSPTAHWVNRGATGDNIVEASFGGTYVQVGFTSYDNDNVIIELPYPSFWLLRVYNTSASGYTYYWFNWTFYEF